MTPTSKIVDAAYALATMDEQSLRDIVKKVLKKNPTVFFEHLGMNGQQLFKVVITKWDPNQKIRLIKMARDVIAQQLGVRGGLGLADTKFWAEGAHDFGNGYVPGVLGVNLSEADAKSLIKRIHREHNLDITLNAVPMDHAYTYPTYRPDYTLRH